MSGDEKADKQQVNPDGAPSSSAPPEAPISPTSHSPAAETPPHDAILEEHHGSEKLGAFLGGLIPVVISFLFHLGLLLIMLFVVFLAEVEVNIEKIEIADDVFSEDPGARLSPSRNISKSTSKSKTQRKHTRDKTMHAGAGKTSKAVKVMGLGGAVGDSAADMGLPVSSAGGSAFFGTKSGGNMRHIVYVIDRSGSMLGFFEDVKMELYRSLARLNGEKQDYHVIMLSESKPLEKTPKRLTPATRKNVKETARWIEGMTAGTATSGGGSSHKDTRAIPALDRAFAVLKGAKGGSLIYLLTDGDFSDGNAKVLAYIGSKNKDRKVHINTFLIGLRKRTAVEVMEKIAKQNGGKYRFVEDY